MEKNALICELYLTHGVSVPMFTDIYNKTYNDNLIPTEIRLIIYYKMQKDLEYKENVLEMRKKIKEKNQEKRIERIKIIQDHYNLTHDNASAIAMWYYHVHNDYISDTTVKNYLKIDLSKGNNAKQRN